MNRNEFKNEMKTRLKALQSNELCHFAWICAVRALPFLSSTTRKFTYWSESARQKYLGHLFYVLDIASNASIGNLSTSDEGVGLLARAIADNAKEYDIIAFSVATAITSSFFAATRTAQEDSIIADTYARQALEALVDAYTNASDMAHAAAVTHANTAADDYSLTEVAALDSDNMCDNFYNILRGDFDAIRNGELDKIQHDSSLLFKKTLRNFKQDLYNTGCGYWANTYQELYDHQFKVDTTVLKQRLAVAPQTRNEGAKTVGDYLKDRGTMLHLFRQQSLGQV